MKNVERFADTEGKSISTTGLSRLLEVSGGKSILLRTRTPYGLEFMEVGETGTGFLDRILNQNSVCGFVGEKPAYFSYSRPPKTLTEGGILESDFPGQGKHGTFWEGENYRSTEVVAIKLEEGEYAQA